MGLVAEYITNVDGFPSFELFNFQREHFFSVPVDVFASKFLDSQKRGGLLDAANAACVFFYSVSAAKLFNFG